MIKAARALARNRAEEMGPDLWNDFVIPRYFPDVPADHVRKPLVIVGGRGCGKATLLRYFAYNSQFSDNRTLIPDSALVTIGMCWRTDLQFLSGFKGPSLTDEEWSRSFEHYLCVCVAEEMIGAIAQLNSKPERRTKYGQVDLIDFSSLRPFDNDIPASFAEFVNHIKRRKYEVGAWIHNLGGDNNSRPRFWPMRMFLEALIQCLKVLPYIKDSTFAFFIDEYESLHDYQKRIVNTAIKQSGHNLVFHVAMKRGGMLLSQTTGSESIRDRDDYSWFDIEAAQSQDFEVFAAELLLFRLNAENIPLKDNPIDASLLRDPTRLSERFGDGHYKSRILTVARSLLPGRPLRAIAEEILKDKALRKTLEAAIGFGLQKDSSQKLRIADFMDENLPEASVVNAVLLRQRKEPTEIKKQFELLRNDSPNRYTKSGDWLHHYLVGAILAIYQHSTRPCPIYAGFDTFVNLSQGNSRHFLELCFKAIGRMPEEYGKPKQEVLPIDIRAQADAARDASHRFLNELKGSGQYGTSLHQFANALGQVLKLFQERPVPGEAERTTFVFGATTPSEEAQTLLIEAEKWGVFLTGPETKVKSPRLTGQEFRFHPIFSPYFGISFRKGRNVEVSGKQFEELVKCRRELSNKVIQEFERTLKAADGGTLFDEVRDEESK